MGSKVWDILEFRITNLGGVLQAATSKGSYCLHIILRFLIAKSFLKDRRLLVIATSCTTILNNLGFPKTFHSELLVPPISSLAAVDKVLGEVALFSSVQEKQRAIGMIDKRKMFPKSRVGIKDLLQVIEMARQEENNIAERLVNSFLKWKDDGK